MLDKEILVASSEASLLMMVSVRMPDRLYWARSAVDDGEIT